MTLRLLPAALGALALAWGGGPARGETQRYPPPPPVCEPTHPLPVCREAEPPSRTVEPGVRIVLGVPGELFAAEGWYWRWWNGHWYRARALPGVWSVVPHAGVPRPIARLPHGLYRHWGRAPHERRVPAHGSETLPAW